MTRVLTGTVSPFNRFAAESSAHGLLAYASQSAVCVLHPASGRLLTTLNAHPAAVIKLCWCPERYPHTSVNSPQHVRLASADTNGLIIIWDVHQAEQHTAFSDGSNKVADMQWYPYQDTSYDFLFVLHPPYSLALWNADSGEKIWKKSFTEPLSSFSLDPFELNKVAFLTASGNLMLIADLTTSKAPSSNGQVYRIAAPTTTSSTSNNTAIRPTSASVNYRSGTGMAGSMLSGGAKLIRGPLKDVFRQSKTSTVDDLGGSSPAAGSPTMGDLSLSSSFGGHTLAHAQQQCFSLKHHPANRDQVIMVYPRCVLFVDTTTLHTISCVQLDKHMSPFVQVHPCSQRDCVYFVQENGSVTLRLARYKHDGTSNPLATVDIYNPLTVYYEAVSSTESMRITKSYRLSATALCPINETQLSLVMTTGRVIVYSLACEEQTLQLCLSDFVSYLPNFVLSSCSKLRFVMTSVYSGVGQQPCVIRARPDNPNVQSPDIDDDKSPPAVIQTSHLLAVGTLDGYVQLINAEDMVVEKEFAVHSSPIRCLEWGGPSRIISAGYSQTLSTSSVVRNEILSTDISNGLAKVIRPEVDESPVELLRVSFYHSYLAIAFRDQPMEIWDIRSFRLLRRMSRACPVIVDMAWSGKHHQAQSMKRALADGEQDENTGASLMPGTENKLDKHTIYRENLVVLDNENHLYHVVVKGMHVKDGKEVNTQWATTSQVVAMVWKGDYLAFGDNDGRLSLWDLGTKQSKASTAQRGAVQQLRFSRAPRSYTLVVLHTDGVAVWDATRFVQLHSLSSTRDLPPLCSVLDVDVCGWDGSLAVLSSDALVRVINTNRWQLNMASFNPTAVKSVFCAALLSADCALLLRTILCDTQTWHNANTTTANDQCDLSTVVRDCLRQQGDLNVDTTEQTNNRDGASPFGYTIDNEIMLAHLNALDSIEQERIQKSTNVAERCTAVAACFGDMWEYILWSLIGYHLSLDQTVVCSPSLDTFWKADHYKRLQMQLRNRSDNITGVTSAATATGYTTRDAALALVALNQLDAAVQLLLTPTEDGAATGTTDADSYADCLLACLLSAEHSSTACQSTVKLVATNLIATGKLTEGVLLLCLIGKSLDACRYLQSASQWRAAASLARNSLTETQSVEIVRKWADQCLNPNKSFALLLYISLHDWSRVIDTLIGARQVNTAALVLNALRERYGDDLVGTTDKDDGGTVSGERLVPKKLTHEVYNEYTRHLINVGALRAARDYCRLTGDMFRPNLEAEINLLETDKTMMT